MVNNTVLTVPSVPRAPGSAPAAHLAGRRFVPMTHWRQRRLSLPSYVKAWDGMLRWRASRLCSGSKFALRPASAARPPGAEKGAFKCQTLLTSCSEDDDGQSAMGKRAWGRRSSPPSPTLLQPCLPSHRSSTPAHFSTAEMCIISRCQTLAGTQQGSLRIPGWSNQKPCMHAGAGLCPPSACKHIRAWQSSRNLNVRISYAVQQDSA